ncbi:hypothetical protein [Sediminispirochaeta smaragdinae]|uniref:Uncharacterized protein n=1 Tax=Sediminispirochaeta smaragdinae (strain DSM 11293 / JCM 15392 / SEBR 4228) TaxID=573413 RepID=E1R4Z8_SEDSS|nr:hypothetical protein [Sediminispirochaeta smaragdinae]ADK80533.1 conserved hypothetical protein [Sediminispirochaeta smaragdinae DSM 11293]
MKKLMFVSFAALLIGILLPIIDSTVVFAEIGILVSAFALTALFLLEQRRRYYKKAILPRSFGGRRKAA